MAGYTPSLEQTARCRKGGNRGSERLIAKAYLEQIAKIEAMITNKLAERERWYEMAQSITAQMRGERVQTSGNQQRMAAAIDRCIDAENEVNAMIDRLIDRKREINSILEQVSTTSYDVLHKRYIQGMGYQAIADSIGCSYSNATTIHGRALIEVQRILDKREKHRDL